MSQYNLIQFNRLKFNVSDNLPTILYSETPAPFETIQFQFIWDTVIPAKNDTINLDVIDIGGKAKYIPQQNNQYQVHIEIADNPSYTNSTEYITEYVDGGIEATYDHPITIADIYYIKLWLEDTSGIVTSTYEYQFDAEEILYFLDNPSVETQAPQANEVTVRSDTDSYTATTNPTPDERIQRIVEIDEGDASVCQAVAEKLIDRWGEEQITVSGPIDLTVTIKFERELKTIVSEANIDGTMILQKKAHNVTGGITNVTLGNIQLSDSELLARILDDLGV